MPRSKRKRTEYHDTKLLCAWLRLHQFCFYHPPNEGLRTVGAWKMLEAMGTSKGMPDMLIFDAPPDYCGCVIELKATDAQKPDPAQQAWLDALSARGWLALSGSLETVIAQLSHYYEIN